MTSSTLPSAGSGSRWAGEFLQDLRYGLRQLWKAPGFAAIAILTVALGIGACTALFSVVNKVVLHPLDYDEPEQIVLVHQQWLPKYPRYAVSSGVYLEWVKQSSVFENLAGIYWSGYRLIQGERYTEIGAQHVTLNYFSVYRLTPELGRIFLPEEMVAGKDQVAILSHNLWQTQFGGRANVLGEHLQLNDKTFTIIGVVRDRQRPFNSVYLPGSAALIENFKEMRMFPAGRLKAGVTIEQAQAEMEVIARRVAQQHPDTNKGFGVTVMREMDLWSSSLRTQLFALLGAVAFLLLIACVNVASLLLARASARQKEFGIRTALGAGRGRIVRQFLCESLLIAVAGGLLGLIFAYASMRPLIALASHFMPHTERIAVDGTVLAVTSGLMLLAGLGFGLVPALQATRGDMIGALKEGSSNASGGRQSQRLRSTLVVVEIAFALMLLIGTGLMIRSLRAMQQFDQGLKTENVYTNLFSLNSERKYDTPDKILAFTRAALERIHSVPEIDSAAFTVGLPMGNRNMVQKRAFILEGGQMPTGPSDNVLLTDTYSVTPEYFRVMSIPLLRGRGLDAHDTAGAAPVVLVNQEMVRKHFPNQDPIGRKLRIFSGPQPKEIWSEIIGVVGDVKPRGPLSETGPQVYQSFEQMPEPLITLVLRARGAAPALPGAMRDIIHGLDKDIKFETIYEFEATISYSWIQQRFNMILFTLFSILALLLAAIGIYGVMAYSVNQRTHEIGIRMALGALPGDVLRLIVGSGAKIIALGLLLGTAGALACTRLLASLLFSTSPYDPITFIAITTILAAVALLACWLPARRATKVDPVVALRAE